MTQSVADFLEIVTDTSKTGIMFVLLVVGIILRVKGYIEGPGFVDLMRTTTVAYFSTTTIVHFTEMLKTQIASKIADAKDSK